MGPELIVTALALYGVTFAVVGAVVGALINRRGAFIAVVGVVAIALGVINACFAPSSHSIEAGLIAFLFAIIVIGGSGALVRALRRNRRARVENTAV